MYLRGVAFISIITGLLQFVSGRLGAVFDPAISVASSTNKIYVHKNSRLIIDCVVSSNPPQFSVSWPRIWLKDNVEVIPQKRVHVADNGSLVIERVLNKRRKGRNDSGVYECFVENSFGQIIGRRVEIIITKQSLSIYPEKVSTFLGGVAKFKCRFNGSSQHMPYYHWQIPSPKGNHVFKDDTSGVAILQVYNVSKEDVGSYTCKVLHNDGMLEKSAFLEINDESSGLTRRRPELLNTVQHVTVERGQTALLECLVQGGTNIAITWHNASISLCNHCCGVHWLHNQLVNSADPDETAPAGAVSSGSSLFTEGLILVPTDTNRLSVLGHSNLKISNVQPDDSGTYICVIAHSGGQDIQQNYTLNVQFAPWFKIAAPQLITHVLAQRDRLPCNVSGNPTPVINWYKDGMRIYPSPEAELIIYGRSDETGYYQCMAENSVGYAISTTWATFDRKSNTPGMVLNARGKALSSTVIQLKWEPVPAPLGYGIDYHKVSDVQCLGRCMHQFHLVRDLTLHTTFNVTNLEPNTNYLLSIQGFNYNGAGAMSEEVLVKTMEAVPTMPPDVQILPDTTTSFRVKWSDLPKSEARGVINKHKLFYGTDVKIQVTELVGSDIRDYLVIGLELDTLYKVRVLAGNSAGYPDISDNWVTYRTPAITYNYNTTTPVLTFEPINASAVHIRWTMDPWGVGSYRIIVQNQLEGGRVHEYNISANKNEFVVGALRNRTFYKVDFMVKDRANNVVSIVTELYESRNPEDIQDPPPPMTLDPIPVSSSVIIVTWKKPKTSLNIVKYTVQYQPRDDLSVMPKWIENTTQMARLEGLQSFTWYVIAVCSHTYDRHGPYTKPIIVQTLEGIPSPPENLLGQVVSPGTVMLQWGPPRKQNGIITYYIIYFNPDKNVPERSWSSIQQNASTTSVVVNDLQGNVYYFKLRACTKAGEGNSSAVIKIDTVGCGNSCPACTSAQSCATNSPADTTKISSVFEQRLGIIIGCSVGLISCVICISVIIVKHRSYQRLRAAAYTSNGHHVGRYLSQQTNEATGTASYSPFLDRGLKENTNSDSKGGHYVVYRSDLESNQTLMSRTQENTLPNGGQLPAERRALLSPSSISSHGNDTSSNPTVDSTTLDSSFTTPDKIDIDITSNKVTSCESSEREESNDSSHVKKNISEGSVNNGENSSIERSQSGSRDSGFEIDPNAHTCDIDKIGSETEYMDRPHHQNINC